MFVVLYLIASNAYSRDCYAYLYFLVFISSGVIKSIAKLLTEIVKS